MSVSACIAEIGGSSIIWHNTVYNYILFAPYPFIVIPYTGGCIASSPPTASGQPILVSQDISMSSSPTLMHSEATFSV